MMHHWSGRLICLLLVLDSTTIQALVLSQPPPHNISFSAVAPPPVVGVASLPQAAVAPLPPSAEISRPLGPNTLFHQTPPVWLPRPLGSDIMQEHRNDLRIAVLTAHENLKWWQAQIKAGTASLAHLNLSAVAALLHARKDVTDQAAEKEPPYKKSNESKTEELDWNPSEMEGKDDSTKSSGMERLAIEDTSKENMNQHVVHSGGLCLDSRDIDQIGGFIRLAICRKNLATQYWVHESTTGYIKNQHGLCLEATEKWRNGGKVAVSKCDMGNENFQWEYFEKTGQIQNFAGACLIGLQPSRDEGIVQTWECDEGTAQIWSLGQAIRQHNEPPASNGKNAHHLQSEIETGIAPIQTKKMSVRSTQTADDDDDNNDDEDDPKFSKKTTKDLKEKNSSEWWEREFEKEVEAQVEILQDAESERKRQNKIRERERERADAQERKDLENAHKATVERQESDSVSRIAQEVIDKKTAAEVDYVNPKLDYENIRSEPSDNIDAIVDKHENLASGHIQHWHDGNCLEASLGIHSNGDVHTLNCEPKSLNQQWAYDTSTGQIINQQGNCLEATPEKVQLWECHDHNQNQEWVYEDSTGHIKNIWNICLTEDLNEGVVKMISCDTSNTLQKWKLGKAYVEDNQDDPANNELEIEGEDEW